MMYSLRKNIVNSFVIFTISLTIRKESLCNGKLGNKQNDLNALKNAIKLMKIDCGDLCDTSINAELRIHKGKYFNVIFK